MRRNLDNAKESAKKLKAQKYYDNIDDLLADLEQQISTLFHWIKKIK